MAPLLIPKIGFLREEIYMLHAKVNPLISRLCQLHGYRAATKYENASDIGATDMSSGLSGTDESICVRDTSVAPCCALTPQMLVDPATDCKVFFYTVVKIPFGG